MAHIIAHLNPSAICLFHSRMPTTAASTSVHERNSQVFAVQCQNKKIQTTSVVQQFQKTVGAEFEVVKPWYI
jgi:hypothetical protein